MKRLILVAIFLFNSGCGSKPIAATRADCVEILSEFPVDFDASLVTSFGAFFIADPHTKIAFCKLQYSENLDSVLAEGTKIDGYKEGSLVPLFMMPSAKWWNAYDLTLEEEVYQFDDTYVLVRGDDIYLCQQDYKGAMDNEHLVNQPMFFPNNLKEREYKLAPL